MKKIIINENCGFVYLNPEFYNDSCVNTTILEFKDFLKVLIKKSRKYLILKFEKVSFEYSLEKLVLEFLNYLLSVEKCDLKNGI